MIDMFVVDLIGGVTTSFVVINYGGTLYRVTTNTLHNISDTSIKFVSSKMQKVHLGKTKLDNEFFDKHIDGHRVFNKITNKRYILSDTMEIVKKSVTKEQYKVIESDIKQKCMDLFNRKETLDKIAFRMNPMQLKEAKDAIKQSAVDIGKTIINYSEMYVKVEDSEMNYVLGKKAIELNWFSEELKEECKQLVSQIPSNLDVLGK